MELQLMRNNSEVKKVNKSLTEGITMFGTLRESSNVLSPSITIEIENPTIYNYAHIPEFNRYYFIKEFESIRKGLWRISLQVDTLYTYKDSILKSKALIRETTYTDKDYYLTGRNWVTKVKEKTEIKTFPSGLMDNGTFILITAGG